MLQILKIQNYALIDQLEISFNSGFSTITGETGAGKSVILGALSLLLGERADYAAVKDPQNKSVIEGEFDLSAYALSAVFAENEVDYDPHTIIRREITSNGKSRAFVNDMPVNLQFLKQLGLHLVDIHSQHENLLLTDASFQLMVVDSIGKLNDTVNQYTIQFLNYKAQQRELSALQSAAATAGTDRDYQQFLFNELDQARLSDTAELSELERELEALRHAEDIKMAYDQTTALLDASETSVLIALKSSLSALSQIQTYANAAVELHHRINSCYIELKDVAKECESLATKIEADPERMQQLTERVDLIYTLLRKHKVQTIDELVAIRIQLGLALEAVDGFAEKIAALQQEIEKQESELHLLADAITAKRCSISPQIEQEVAAMLQVLGMPHVQFSVVVSSDSELRQNGKDTVAYMFSANRNVAQRAIAEVASGGELSRVMLCLKAILSKAKALPTIIFDEIDTGVSGDIAERMAAIMQQMAENMQVLSITHLPQIASKGKHHYFVYKTHLPEGTLTSIRQLTAEERVSEIAKMLSGAQLTDAAMKNAKELLRTK